MSAPAWLGIGAQRSGTTWFTDLLTQHPEVGLGTNGKKEQHLLHKVADGVIPPEDYLGLFPSDGVRRGEWTPQYLRHASAPAAARVAANRIAERNRSTGSRSSTSTSPSATACCRPRWTPTTRGSRSG